MWCLHLRFSRRGSRILNAVNIPRLIPSPRFDISYIFFIFLPSHSLPEWFISDYEVYIRETPAWTDAIMPMNICKAVLGVRGPRDWVVAFSRLEKKKIKFVNFGCKTTQIETRFVIQLLVAWLKDGRAWFAVFLENRSSRVGRRWPSTLD